MWLAAAFVPFLRDGLVRTAFVAPPGSDRDDLVIFVAETPLQQGLKLGVLGLRNLGFNAGRSSDRRRRRCMARPAWTRERVCRLLTQRMCLERWPGLESCSQSSD